MDEFVGLMKDIKRLKGEQAPDKKAMQVFSHCKGATKALNKIRKREGHDKEWCSVYVLAEILRSTPALVEWIQEEKGYRTSLFLGVFPWRFTQGVYRYDDEVYKQLISTPLEGRFPLDVIVRIPQKSVYIETPGFDWDGVEVKGFFASLICQDQCYILSITLNMFDQLIPITLFPGEDSKTIKDQLLSDPPDKGGMLSDIDLTAKNVSKLVSLLVYLCVEEPEIDSQREPGESPFSLAVKADKKGGKLYPAKQPRVWNVGCQTGEKLRESYAYNGHTDRKVSPHIRKAHWHGYWLGPRTGKRTFVYRWIPPTLVGDS